jgi:hypothetical protein
MYSVQQQYVDAASGFHVIELADERGNRHMVQLAVKHAACAACGWVHPRDAAGVVDPAKAVAQVVEGLHTQQTQLRDYAARHGLTVR